MILFGEGVNVSFDYKLLGKKIKEARESLLIEKEEVANYLRCSVKEYEKIEHGELNRIDGDTIIIISQILEMDFRYLFQVIMYLLNHKSRNFLGKMEK